MWSKSVENKEKAIGIETEKAPTNVPQDIVEWEDAI